MTINLPADLENFVRAEVLNGHFASEDDVVAEAVRTFLRQQTSASTRSAGAGLIGALRDDAELLDRAVEHAMKVREERPWRLSPGE